MYTYVSRPPIQIPSSCWPFTDTASLSGEAEKQVSMVTVPPARALACVNPCQHSSKVFHQRLKSLKSEAHIETLAVEVSQFL